MSRPSPPDREPGETGADGKAARHARPAARRPQRARREISSCRIASSTSSPKRRIEFSPNTTSSPAAMAATRGSSLQETPARRAARRQAIKRSGIKIMPTQFGRDPRRNRSLSGSRRPIDGNHRNRLGYCGKPFEVIGERFGHAARLIAAHRFRKRPKRKTWPFDDHRRYQSRLPGHEEARRAVKPG